MLFIYSSSISILNVLSMYLTGRSWCAWDFRGFALYPFLYSMSVCLSLSLCVWVCAPLRFQIFTRLIHILYIYLFYFIFVVLSLFPFLPFFPFFLPWECTFVGLYILKSRNLTLVIEAWMRKKCQKKHPFYHFNWWYDNLIQPDIVSISMQSKFVCSLV